VDTSVAVTWAIEDERNPDSERLLTAIRNMRAQLVVPELWFYEGLNAIRSAVLRKRLSERNAAASAGFLCQLPKAVVPVTEPRMTEALRLSLETGLTVYDAAYVALARERGADLVTWDKQLLETSCPGVRLLSPKEFSA
jgi:predicted nucleic acid-binding protein